MATSNPVKTLDLFQAFPAFNSQDSHLQFSLPLTFFDIAWFKFPPVECLFFYKFNNTATESTHSLFHFEILPKLKHSLSHTLAHFLPLAGHLTWPLESPRPVIVYISGDSVALKVAESNSEFDRFIDNDRIREAIESSPYIPELPTSDTMASIIALQITLFPNKGFCIGLAVHKQVFDGQSLSLFLKSWAHVCKHISLAPELILSFDRTVIKDSEGLEQVYLDFINQWGEVKAPVDSGSSRSLKLLPNLPQVVSTDLVRARFRLSQDEIKKLKENIILRHHQVITPRSHTKRLHLSTFLVTLAYVSVCRVKSRQLDSDKKVHVILLVDCRKRSDSAIPLNYFGNCVVAHDICVEAGVLMEENGVSFLAEKFSDLVERLEKGGVFGGVKESVIRLRSEEVQKAGDKFGVAGSPRLGFYEMDFGWGKPEVAEITSIARTRGISVMENRDGNGGVEVTLALSRSEMEKFASLFKNGLNCISSNL